MTRISSESQNGLYGIHYTTIHKAIRRPPECFLEEVMRILAEMTSKNKITAIVDATIFTFSCYEDRTVIEEKKVKVTKCTLGR